jgi:hypothetical protein
MDRRGARAKIAKWLAKPITGAARKARKESTVAEKPPTVTTVAGQAEGEAETDKPRALDPVYKAAGRVVLAVGGALTLAGVVAVVGAAMLWLRFDRAGLPAEQAVGSVPNEQLIVYGALGIVVSVVIGLLAVLIIFALDPCGTVTRGTALGVAGILLGGFIYGATSADLPCWAQWVLFGFAVLLGFGILGVANGSGARFPPLAAAVFLGAAAFGIMLSFLQTESRTSVQPVAVITDGGSRLKGVYVADTDKAVYLGLPIKANDVTLTRVERTETTRVAIGHLMTKPDAEKAAKKMLDQLAKRLPQKATASNARATRTAQAGARSPSPAGP